MLQRHSHQQASKHTSKSRAHTHLCTTASSAYLTATEPLQAGCVCCGCLCAGAGRAHSSGRASQPAPGCSPVWHTNPCCVASPDAPVEVLGPAPGAGAGTAGAPHEDGSASPPDPASAEPADGWQVQQQGGRLGSGAPAWASPPLPRVRVPRPAPLTQPSASACSGLLLGLACENSSRSSSREQEGWAEAPCGMAGAGEQQQQQQQQQQQLSRVQQQLRALEDLQLPQPGGVTPAKLRQHTSRRTQLWDEQSSSNRVSRRPLSLSLQSMDGIRWDDGLMMRGGGSLDASIAGSKGDGGGLQSGRVPWSARGSSSGSGCSSFELGSAPERRNQEGEGGLDAETKDKAALRFAQVRVWHVRRGGARSTQQCGSRRVGWRPGRSPGIGGSHQSAQPCARMFSHVLRAPRAALGADRFTDQDGESTPPKSFPCVVTHSLRS